MCGGDEIGCDHLDVLEPVPGGDDLGEATAFGCHPDRSHCRSDGFVADAVEARLHAGPRAGNHVLDGPPEVQV